MFCGIVLIKRWLIDNRLEVELVNESLNPWTQVVPGAFWPAFFGAHLL
jgi:hypothetical protein